MLVRNGGGDDDDGEKFEVIIFTRLRLEISQSSTTPGITFRYCRCRLIGIVSQCRQQLRLGKFDCRRGILCKLLIWTKIEILCLLRNCDLAVLNVFLLFSISFR